MDCHAVVWNLRGGRPDKQQRLVLSCRDGQKAVPRVREQGIYGHDRACAMHNREKVRYRQQQVFKAVHAEIAK